MFWRKHSRCNFLNLSNRKAVIDFTRLCWRSISCAAVSVGAVGSDDYQGHTYFHLGIFIVKQVCRVYLVRTGLD